MRVLRILALLIVVPVILGSLSSRPVQAASLVEVTNFGTNPTHLRMHLYVPNVVQARPAILLAIHYCTGTGPAFYSGTEFASLADRYGFIVIYPSATRSGACWDVSSAQALRRDGGSDPVGLMSMVRYVLQNNGADPNRIYVTGASSGGMMTNVMLGNYPDVFKAGASFMGVPHSCFAASAGDPTNPANQAGWNSACAQGQSIKTAQQWGDLVRGAYPGYTGSYPRMQVWHGTNDTTLQYPNFGEQIKQWTNLHGLSQTPSSTATPQSGWTRTRYADSAGNVRVEGYSLQGVGHNLPQSGQAALAISFFGLDGTQVPPTPTRTNTGVPPTATRTNTGVAPSATSTTNPVPNLLQNGGFELDGDNNGQPDGWGANAATSRSSAARHGGSFSLRHYSTGNVAYVSSQVVYGITPGASYSFSGWTSIPATGDAFTYRLELLWRNSANSTIGTSVVKTYTAATNGAWDLASGTFIAPANSSNVVVRMNVASLAATIYADDFSLTSGSTPPPSATPQQPTATRTGSAVPPTPTSITPPTPTTGSGGGCSPATAITAPFTRDGAGSFCWQIATIPSYINSWNLTSLTVNGVDFTNRWASPSQLPAKINGYWYISYSSSVAWGHFEAR